MSLESALAKAHLAAQNAQTPEDKARHEANARKIAGAIRRNKDVQEYTPERVGALEAGLIGAGRVVDKTISGVQDLYYRATGDDEAVARLRAEQAGNDRAYAQLQESNPVASAVGEIGGYLPSAMIPGGLRAQMAVAGAMGSAQYEENPWMRLLAGVEDAALAGVGAKFMEGVQKLASVGTRFNADKLGYKLTPGEQLNNSTLQRLEASLESTPVVGTPVRRVKEARQQVVNRVAAEAVGADTLADDGIADVVARLGNEYDRLLTGKTFAVDDAFLDSLGKMEEVTRKSVMGGGNTKTVIDNILERISSGSISGDELQTMRSTLQDSASRAARDPSSSKPYVDSLNAAVEAIDDLIERNLTPDDMDAWKAARGQYRALVQLERSGAINEMGDVSGRKLGGYLNRTDKGYSRGTNQSDLYNAARLSRAYAPMADSGTATRLSVPLALSTGVSGGTNLLGGRLAAEAYMRPGIRKSITTGADAAARSQDMVNELYRIFVKGEEEEKDTTQQEMLARILRQ